MQANVAIAVVSEKPYAEGYGDNPNPTISEADQLAIKHLKQHAQKVIVVVISGRPLIMSGTISAVDAVIASWLPGSEGAGVADVLFGYQPFKAKLPLSWPASLDQVPMTVENNTADGSAPLYKRGFGLTTVP